MTYYLREHVLDLAAQYGIEVDERPGARGRAFHGKPRQGVRPRIVVPPIRGQVSYFVALHELGHLRHRGRSLMRRLDKEGAAWQWALDHALVEPTPRTWRSIWRSLSSYGQWSRGHATAYREEDSPVFIAVVDRVLAALR